MSLVGRVGGRGQYGSRSERSQGQMVESHGEQLGPLKQRSDIDFSKLSGCRAADRLKREGVEAKGLASRKLV